jgi:hypothetical protein
MNTDKKTPIDSNQETDSAITPEERDLLDDSLDNSLTSDNENLRRSALDNTDEEGELLNVASMNHDLSGNDLDVPGSEDDDDNEEIGEEDEENNSYSQADTE